MLLSAALLAYTYRDEVPGGPGSGEPFGWLALGGVYVAMMPTMAVSMARGSRQIAVDGLAAVAEQRFRRVNVLVPVLVGYGVAIQLSAMTVESIPAFGDSSSGRVGLGNWRAWLLIIGMVLAPMIAGRLLFWVTVPWKQKDLEHGEERSCTRLSSRTPLVSGGAL